MAKKKQTEEVVEEVKVEEPVEPQPEPIPVVSEPSFTKAALIASASLYYRVVYRLALEDGRLYTRTEALQAVEQFKKGN